MPSGGSRQTPTLESAALRQQLTVYHRNQKLPLASPHPPHQILPHSILHPQPIPALQPPRHRRKRLYKLEPLDPEETGAVPHLFPYPPADPPVGTAQPKTPEHRFDFPPGIGNRLPP